MDPDEITAWATVGLMLATFVTCFLIWHGIQAMNRSSDQRAKDREARERTDLRRHKESMDEAQKRHDETMNEAQKRHDEAMNVGQKRHDEAMVALRALIERTAPASTRHPAD